MVADLFAYIEQHTGYHLCMIFGGLVYVAVVKCKRSKVHKCSLTPVDRGSLLITEFACLPRCITIRRAHWRTQWLPIVATRRDFALSVLPRPSTPTSKGTTLEPNQLFGRQPFCSNYSQCCINQWYTSANPRVPVKGHHQSTRVGLCSTRLMHPIETLNAFLAGF